MVLGQLQPVTIVTQPKSVVKQVIAELPFEPTARDSVLLESVHVEKSFSPDQVEQLHDLTLEFADVFALDQHELGSTDLVT